MEVILLLNAVSNNILKTALASDVKDSESESETEELLNLIISTQVCRLRKKQSELKDM